MRIGVFGGTFDPPHLAHLVLAEEACQALDLERLLWVLTPDPPHKRQQRITPAAVRFELLQAALAGNPSFEISRVDLDRPPPHYAVDTIDLLQDHFPGADLVYLMGEDSLGDLPDWYQPVELVARLAGIGVMRRPGFPANLAELETHIPGLTARVTFFETPLLEISSTDIRARAAEGRSFRYFLPPPVYELITRMGLYLEV